MYSTREWTLWALGLSPEGCGRYKQDDWKRWIGEMRAVQGPSEKDDAVAIASHTALMLSDIETKLMEVNSAPFQPAPRNTYANSSQRSTSMSTTPKRQSTLWNSHPTHEWIRCVLALSWKEIASMSIISGHSQ